MAMSQYKTKKQEENAPAQAESEGKDRLKKREWIGISIGVFSLLSVILGLLGHGVILAVNNKFSFPHESLFSSSFDLIEISIWALVRVINNLDKFPGLWVLYLNIITPLIPVVIGFFVFWIACVLLWKYDFKTKRQVSKAREWLLKLFSKISAQDSRILLIWKGFFYCLSFLIGMPLFSVIFVSLFLLCVALSPMFTLMGINAGEAYIDQYVINPQACAPLANRTQRMASQSAKKTKEKGPDNATCILITKDEKELGRGRVVFTTTSAVILFDPATGDVTRIPTKDATIHLISDLEQHNAPAPPAPPKPEPKAVSRVKSRVTHNLLAHNNRSCEKQAAATNNASISGPPEKNGQPML